MNRHAVILICAGLGLAACGEQDTDLTQFVKQAENLPRQRIPPLPDVKPYEPASYDAYQLVDPFNWRRIEPPKKAGAGRLQPDLNRRREPLEAYALENLRMVGTLQRGSEIYALVKSPDNNLFRVKPGNYMGQNFGQIKEVTEATIKLKEIVQDSIGDWTERDSTLTLIDEETKETKK